MSVTPQRTLSTKINKQYNPPFTEAESSGCAAHRLLTQIPEVTRPLQSNKLAKNSSNEEKIKKVKYQVSLGWTILVIC